jgi:hypothetical protein
LRGRIGALSARTTADLLAQPLAIHLLYAARLQKANQAAEPFVKEGWFGK